jgi:diguanylate cyclase (GGDEF)-like protein/PAS domain S-box-containing protein
MMESHKESIRILHLEDSVTDSELIARELAKSGAPITIRRVETREAFLRELEGFKPHLVLSDNSLPQFDSHGALLTLRKTNPELPFILVSGTIGEERAVEILKKGATDYVLKDRLSKLASAVSRALDEARERDARLQAETALRESAQRFRELADAMPQIVWTARSDGSVEYYNKRWYEFTGFSQGKAETPGWASILVPEDLETFLAKTQAAQQSGEAYELECRFKDQKSGTHRWHLVRAVPIADPSGTVARWFGTATDIDDRKRAEQELLRNAYYDPLTKLPNRSFFENRLTKAARVAGREKNLLFAVLFLDVDRFKLVNDSLGHGAGDELLTAFSRRLESLVRPGDTVARFGGDEFAILLEQVKDLQDLTQIARRILEGLSRPFSIHGHEVVATASIGIAHSAGPHGKPDDLLRDADLAMYRAKSLGRSRIEIFDEEMREQSIRTLKLDGDLRRALDRTEFLLYYQPIVSLETGRITGCEALLRWNHPERGLVAPAEFIPLAEETGLIVPIGEWVLRTACAEMHSWTDAGLAPLDLSVNLSARQLKHDGMAAMVGAALKTTGFDARRLKLELTESILMEYAERTIATLRDLRTLGVQLSIDDFGTGYSSLAYLKRLPCTSLKIDRSFVRDINSDPDDSAIASAIISMAHDLRLKVIAEGIETEEQRRFLVSKRCDEGQGYLFSRPMPADRFIGIARQHRIWP